MFYLESLYPDLPIILVTHHCDAMSEEGTFKKEGFIVHRMNNPSWRGSHGNRSWGADGFAVCRQERVAHSPPLTSLFLFHPQLHPRADMPTFRVVLPSPLTPLWKYPPRHSHMCSHRDFPFKFAKTIKLPYLSLCTCTFSYVVMPFMSKF